MRRRGARRSAGPGPNTREAEPEAVGHDGDRTGPDDDVAPTLSRSQRRLRLLGKVGFWTVGLAFGWYAGFFAWLVAFHAAQGGCMYDVCIPQSWPRAVGLAALSGVTLAVWLKWAAWVAWKTPREMSWLLAGGVGAAMAALPIVGGRFFF